MKKTLFFFVLALFSISVYSQSFLLNLYMYSGPYSNPALSGIKEYGTSFTSQLNYGNSLREVNNNVGLWNQRYGLDQSLFHGRAGLQLQWNQYQMSNYFRVTDASLAYSHGFNLGNDVVLRAGIGSSFNSNAVSGLNKGANSGGFDIPDGSDLNMLMSAGVSVHWSKFYAALGVHDVLIKNVILMEGLRFGRHVLLAGEFGARLPLGRNQIKKWSWSAQPYGRLYYEGSLNGIVGSFLNFGPLQIGTDISSFYEAHFSAGVHSRFIRANYSYSLGTSGIGYFGPKHEVALRFILPTGVCRRSCRPNFMGQVYRGF